MSLPLRILLIIGSLFTVVIMLRRIRNSKVQIRDSIYWIVVALALVVLSIFPGIAIRAADLFGIASPINFVYLLIIFMLLVQVFFSTVRISQLDTRVKHLAQRLALYEKDEEESAGARQGRDEAGGEQKQK